MRGVLELWGQQLVAVCPGRESWNIFMCAQSKSRLQHRPWSLESARWHVSCNKILQQDDPYLAHSCSVHRPGASSQWHTLSTCAALIHSLTMPEYPAFSFFLSSAPNTSCTPRHESLSLSLMFTSPQGACLQLQELLLLQETC
jgi:hypothetical protein